MDAKALPDYNPETEADWTVVTKPVSMDLHNSSGVHAHRIKYYNDHAKYYDSDMNKHDYKGTRYVAYTVAKYLEGKEDSRILDIGGGSGSVAQHLQTIGDYRNIEVFDPAEKLVEIAMEQGLYQKAHVRCFQTDSGIPEESYDLVSCCGAFMPGHLKADSVREMARILKPGGIMVIGLRDLYLETDPDLGNFHSELERLVTTGICQRYEHSIVPHWYSNLPGSIFVYKKN